MSDPRHMRSFAAAPSWVVPAVIACALAASVSAVVLTAQGGLRSLAIPESGVRSVDSGASDVLSPPSVRSVSPRPTASARGTGGTTPARQRNATGTGSAGSSGGIRPGNGPGQGVGHTVDLPGGVTIPSGPINADPVTGPVNGAVDAVAGAVNTTVGAATGHDKLLTVDDAGGVEVHTALLSVSLGSG
jgi:hypothetical protein